MACGAALRAARIGQAVRIQVVDSIQNHLYSHGLTYSFSPPKAGGPQATFVYLRASVPPVGFLRALRALRTLPASLTPIPARSYDFQHLLACHGNRHGCREDACNRREYAFHRFLPCQRQKMNCVWIRSSLSWRLLLFVAPRPVSRRPKSICSLSAWRR